MPSPACEAGDQVQLYPLRGFAAVVSVLILVLGASAAFWWVLRQIPAPEESNSVVIDKLLARRERNAERAMSEEKYRVAFHYYAKMLRFRPNDKEILYRAGICLEKTGQEDRAVDCWLKAANGEGAVTAATRRLARQFYKQANVRMAGRYAQRLIKGGDETAPLLAIAADGWILEGKRARAVSLLERAARMAPGNQVVSIARGHHLAVNGEHQRAAELLEEVKESSPFYPLALLYQAELLWRRGQVQSGIARLRRLVNKRPALPGARVLLVKTLLADGQREEALAEVKRSRINMPHRSSLLLSMAYVLNDYGLGDRALDMAYSLLDGPATAVPAHLLAAEILMSRGLPRRARPHAEAALERSPDNVAALLAAGRISRAAADARAAEKLLTRATEISPKNPTTYLELGRTQMELEYTERALANLRKARDLRPDAGRYHYAYGVALMRAGRGEEGARELSEAARRGHNPCAAYTKLGMWARATGRNNQATDYYFKALNASPREAVVASNDLAAMMLDAGTNPPLALALAYYAHLNADSSGLASHTADTLAEALMNTGNAARAVPLARQAAEAKPNDQERIVRLGTAEAAAGQQAHAIATFRRAIDLGPQTDLGQEARQILDSIDRQDSTPEVEPRPDAAGPGD